MKFIEEPDRVIVEEKGDTLLTGCGGLLVASVSFMILATIVSRNASGVVAFAVSFFLAPFLLIGLYLLNKPHTRRHVFDKPGSTYSIESVRAFGVKTSIERLDRIKDVQVATWERSNDSGTFSVYDVKLVFHENTSSLNDRPKQTLFSTGHLEPAVPLKVAAAISNLLSFPEPQIVKTSDMEEFLSGADNWFDNLTKKIDKRFR